MFLCCLIKRTISLPPSNAFRFCFTEVARAKTSSRLLCRMLSFTWRFSRGIIVQFICSHPKSGCSRSLTMSQISSSLASGGSWWSPPECEVPEELVISIIVALSEDVAALLS